MFGCSLRPPDATCVHLPVQPYWQELVLAIVAFGLVCFVLMKYVFPRMEATFQARLDATDGGSARAEATRAEAAQALAEYRGQIAIARAEATAIRESARVEAAAIRDGVLANAREEAEVIIAAGRQQLRAERERIRHELRGQLGTLAVDLAGRILGESLEDEVRRNGAVARFLVN